MLRLISDDTAIPFMKARFIGLSVSALVSIVSGILFFIPGLNYGIDFRGGIVIEARSSQPIDFAQLRIALSNLEIGHIALQEFGTPQDVLIRLERQAGPETAQQQVIEQVRQHLTNTLPDPEIRRVEAVGASVSNDLIRSGLMAVGLGFLAMFIYIWFRFEWQFGLGAVITLVLDIIKMIGFYAITSLQFNLTSVAAILIIIGYSINDKVVIYDRMRENLRLYKKMSLGAVINLSINQTLNRTLGTSLTTLLAALPLAIFGGTTLESFSIPLIFGIIIGTLSSIFIAAPILLFLGQKSLRQETFSSSVP